jgi:acetylornithine deacetylase/succinyl-diaminopimelate desuccinylase-like protein
MRRRRGRDGLTRQAGGPPAIEVLRFCRDLIRIDTSNPGSTEEAAARYITDVLARAEVATEVVEPEQGRCSVFARHDGADRSSPALLVHAHLDVVPADPSGWSYDPLGGIEAEGHIWGRGAVDMKDVAAMMLALQLEIARNEVAPRRTLIFAYFADEEMGSGLGSKWVVENRPDLLADATVAMGEMGGFAVPVADGRRLYPLQSAERGMLWARIRVPGTPGHAAFSATPNPTARLAEVIERVVALRTDDPPPDAFRQLVERVRDVLRAPDEDEAALLGRLGAFGRMALKARATTFVPTVISSGIKVNVIPEEAMVTVDCRFVPGGRENALAAIHSVLDEDMTCEVIASTPGLSLPTADPFATACAAAVAAVEPTGVVVPFVLAAGTDAQHLAPLGIRGYGFAPLVLEPGFDYPAMFHAVDERVPIDALVRGYEIFRRVVLNY